MTLVLLGLLGCWSTPEPSSEPAPADDTDAGWVAGPRPPAPDTPNLLVVVWDTVRADRMSLYGYPKPTTPKLDAWAAERGVVYERAVSPGVFTLPSHASLFTGVSPRQHGVNDDDVRLDDAFPTIAASLYAAGYDTWAFVANPYLMRSSGLLDGFATVERPWDDRWRAAVEAHIDGKLSPEDASTALSPRWEEGRRTGKKNKYLFKEAGPVAAQAFGAFLDARPEPERPFFAFVNYMEAHIPRVPSLAARRAVMTEAEIERSWTVVQQTRDFHEWMAGVRTYDALDLAALSGVYDASLIDLDAATAELFAELDRRGIAEDTLVVLVSDHGEQLGEHGLMLHKYSVYDVLAHVPLVIAWPGHLPPGRVADVFPVEDTLAHVAALGGLPIDERLRAHFDDRPAAAVGGAVVEYLDVAEAVFRRVLRKHPDVDVERFSRTWSALVRGSHKLIEGSDGSVQLYDVLADPGELRDLATTSPEVAAELRGELARWRELVGTGTAPTPGGRKRRDRVGKELREGLEALGYVQ